MARKAVVTPSTFPGAAVNTFDVKVTVTTGTVALSEYTDVSYAVEARVDAALLPGSAKVGDVITSGAEESNG